MSTSSRLTHLECTRCRRDHDPARPQQRCACGGALACRYDLRGLGPSTFDGRARGMWRYRELLPVAGDPVSLGEPETPLLTLDRLSERWGVEARLKDESPLPGGTFKARGAAVGISRARELGIERIVMPSAGNAGGAWALYAARAGIRLTVTMARDAPETNRVEVLAAGAELVLVDGTLADAGLEAARIAAETGAFLAATFAEPYRLEGKKAAWLEAFEQRGWSFPRTVIVPVGGGVGAVACAKAAEEARVWTTGEPPRIVGVQAEACAPLARAWARSLQIEPWSAGASTIAAGLRVPAPAEGPLVLDAVRASGGRMIAVSDEQIIEAVRDLASLEGVFACPEGASCVAAAAILAAADALEGPVIVYNTGTGAKYADLLAPRLT